MTVQLPSSMRHRLRAVRPVLESLGVMKPVSFGLNGLDRKLLEYVGFRGGVYIEAGANDGCSQSNTFYLERYLGWHGLLVEPVPELAAKCRENRPGSLVEECALVASGDQRPFVEMTFCNLMSLVEGARGSDEGDAAHVKIGEQYLGKGQSVRKITVRTARLSELLERHQLRQVDLLSLDVEGFEPQALMGLDFDAVSPTWILVEANDSETVEKVLQGRYELVAHLSHHDRLYRVLP